MQPEPSVVPGQCVLSAAYSVRPDGWIEIQPTGGSTLPAAALDPSVSPAT